MRWLYRKSYSAMRGFCISRIHWLADLTCHLVTTALEVTVSRGKGVVKVCHQCGGKFGLVRHHYLRYSFCSRQCLECFKQRLVEGVSLRKVYGWFRHSS